VKAAQSLPERVFQMRSHGVPWIRIQRTVRMPINELQRLAAEFLKERGGARTPETLLGPNT
jgi:hypothetical protein